MTIRQDTLVQKLGDEEELYKKLERELGPTIRKALDDKSVVEIAVNPDGYVRLERHGEGWELTAERLKPSRVVALLSTIATLQGTIVNRAKPVLESRIPGIGSRIVGVLPPCSQVPVFTIRRHSTKRIALDDYVRDGRMSQAVCDVLKEAVAKRHSILVGGGTGSGKTTLVNALALECVVVEPTCRLLFLEDTPELALPSGWCLAYETGGVMDLDGLLKVALRSRPDRIIVGEVRGAEVLALLRASNTGHEGTIATLHCNSAEAALLRLEQLASLGANGFPPRDEIAEAIQVVVFAEKGPRGPRIREVIRVRGREGDSYRKEAWAA